MHVVWYFCAFMWDAAYTVLVNFWPDILRVHKGSSYCLISSHGNGLRNHQCCVLNLSEVLFTCYWLTSMLHSLYNKAADLSFLSHCHGGTQWQKIWNVQSSHLWCWYNRVRPHLAMVNMISYEDDVFFVFIPTLKASIFSCIFKFFYIVKLCSKT